MNTPEQDQWLTYHIPHRLRACLADLPLQKELMPQDTDAKTQQILRNWLLGVAGFEGRMVAMRWLIEFVGVGRRNKEGKVDPPIKRRPTDVSINMIKGGKEIDLDSAEAEILADVRQGCEQASGHPTRGTNHPSVDDASLDKALRIIVEHLERTIYAGRARDLITETFDSRPYAKAPESRPMPS